MTIQTISQVLSSFTIQDYERLTEKAEMKAHAQALDDAFEAETARKSRSEAEKRKREAELCRLFGYPEHHHLEYALKKYIRSHSGLDCSPACPRCGGMMGLIYGEVLPFWRCLSHPECRGAGRFKLPGGIEPGEIKQILRPSAPGCEDAQ